MYEPLELHEVKEQVAKHASFSLGKQLIRQMMPRFDALWVRRELARVKEAYALVVRFGNMPFGGIHDTRDSIEAAMKDMTLTPHELRGIADSTRGCLLYTSLCEKHDLLIMNDEIWSDILYPDAQFNSIYCLGEERCKRVVSVFGFSKSFGLAGLRIGCVYANDDEKFQKLVDASDVLSTAGGATSLSQIAAIAAMEETQEWRAAFLKHITKNRDYACLLYTSSA